jgi:two-component system, cell cycle response regulator CtrA
MFLDHLYTGVVHEPESKIIDVFVCKLRKKMTGVTSGDHYITTVWGRGYILLGDDVVGLDAEWASCAR